MKFLNELEEHSTKKAYQTYIFEHGIEKLTLLIPLAEAGKFQTEFFDAPDKSKKSLLEVVKRFGGKVR